MVNKKIIVFWGKKIRRVWHEGEWYFSVIDIIRILTDSLDANNYWKVLKHRENQLVTNCNQLKLKSSDGKSYFTDCANKKGIFRILQSIPSKKAEPFKLWLAKVGSERIEEIEPELLERNVYKRRNFDKDIGLITDFMLPGNFSKLPDDSYFSIGGYYGI